MKTRRISHTGLQILTIAMAALFSAPLHGQDTLSLAGQWRFQLDRK